MTVNIVENPKVRLERIGNPSRAPGISAFLRVKNGADYIESAIRSHIYHFDEIVAVFNGCTDDTPDILARLSLEFRGRLRIFDYRPEVFPPGSPKHATESASSPHSLVHYSNFALAQTRYKVVTKLDDDHIALDIPLEAICRRIRACDYKLATVWCFSGLNLARMGNGSIGIPVADPISGTGDIGFFTPTWATRFRHDSRFERFDYGDIPRKFTGFLYWHMKYLKSADVFANYDLEKYPNSRFHKKKSKFETSEIIPLSMFRSQIQCKYGAIKRIFSRLNAKLRLKVERDCAAVESFPQRTLEDAITETCPKFAKIILQNTNL